MTKYEFQVNLGFSKKIICGCGMTPDGVRAFTASSLRLLLRKICKHTGLRVEQIVLTFSPNGPQP